MNVKKIFVFITLLLTCSIYPETIKEAQKVEPQQSHATQRLIAITLRLIEAGAGIHMFWYGDPRITTFLSLTEEREITRNDSHAVRKEKIERFMVPSGIINLIRELDAWIQRRWWRGTPSFSTASTGALLSMDGVFGLIRELKELMRKPKPVHN